MNLKNLLMAAIVIVGMKTVVLSANNCGCPEDEENKDKVAQTVKNAVKKSYKCDECQDGKEHVHDENCGCEDKE